MTKVEQTLQCTPYPAADETSNSLQAHQHHKDEACGLRPQSKSQTYFICDRVPKAFTHQNICGKERRRERCHFTPQSHASPPHQSWIWPVQSEWILSTAQ